MTKKDYELIANKIKQQIDLRCRTVYPTSEAGKLHYNEEYFALTGVAEHLREAFAENNPKFDPEKFNEACGIYTN